MEWKTKDLLLSMESVLLKIILNIIFFVLYKTQRLASLSMESVLLKDLNLSPIGPGMYGHCSIEAEEVSFIICTRFLYYFVVVFFGISFSICI